MQNANLPTLNLPIRKAVANDFHSDGKPNVGMIYILENQQSKFEVYRLKEGTPGEKIQPFLTAGKVWVVADVNDYCCDLEIKEIQIA